MAGTALTSKGAEGTDKFSQWLAELEEEEKKLETGRFDYRKVPLKRYRATKLKEYIPGAVSLLNVSYYPRDTWDGIIEREQSFYRHYLPRRNVVFQYVEDIAGTMHLAAIGVDVRESNRALFLYHERKRLEKRLAEMTHQTAQAQQQAALSPSVRKSIAMEVRQDQSALEPELTAPAPVQSSIASRLFKGFSK
jgi:hypothetical protein